MWEGKNDLLQMSWDHPLSQLDVWRRVLAQCDRLRQLARGQASEAQNVSKFTRELAREHKAMCSRVGELEKQCQEARHDATTARQEVDWLKKVLEAMIGLSGRSASDIKDLLPSTQRCSVQVARQLGPQNHVQHGTTQLCNSSRAGSEANAGGVRTTGSGGTGDSSAHHRTIMRRMRRRLCRQRRQEAALRGQEEGLVRSPSPGHAPSQTMELARHAPNEAVSASEDRGNTFLQAPAVVNTAALTTRSEGTYCASSPRFNLSLSSRRAGPQTSHDQMPRRTISVEAVILGREASQSVSGTVCPSVPFTAVRAMRGDAAGIMRAATASHLLPMAMPAASENLKVPR